MPHPGANIPLITDRHRQPHRLPGRRGRERQGRECTTKPVHANGSIALWYHANNTMKKPSRKRSKDEKDAQKQGDHRTNNQ
jgi:hypothetical protein